MLRFDHQKLTQHRKRAGLSRRQLAAEIGRSYPQVARYECGTYVPPTDVLGRIASRLGVSIASFFTDDQQVAS